MGLSTVAYAVINDGAGGGQHQSGVDRLFLAIAAIRSANDLSSHCASRAIGLAFSFGVSPHSNRFDHACNPLHVVAELGGDYQSS